MFLHLFLTSALDESDRSASRTDRFIPTGILKGEGIRTTLQNLDRRKVLPLPVVGPRFLDLRVHILAVILTMPSSFLLILK